MNSRSVRKINIVSFAIFIAGAAGIFLLPWYVPMKNPVDSYSYTYGFNNFVAYMAMAMLLAALFLAALWRRRICETGWIEQALMEILPDERDDPPSRGLWIAFVAATGVTVALVVWWYLMLPYAYFGEMGYFVSRIDLMQLGYRPYSDFQFIHGPALIYPAYWLYNLAAGHLSIDAAYCASLVCQWVAGNWFLYYVIRQLKGGVNRTMVFLCIILGGINIVLGSNYTTFRFVTPMASLFFLHCLVAARTGRENAARFARIAAAAFLVPFASFAISPEIGLASILGCVGYFCILARVSDRKYAWFTVASLLSLPLAYVLFRREYFEAVFAFGAGGNTFPILPTMHILLFCIAACCILPGLAVSGLIHRTEKGALAVALTLSLGLLIPAALARCDYGHVFWNGIGIFVLFLALCSKSPHRVWRWLPVSAFAAIYIGAGWLIFWNMDKDQIASVFSGRRAKAALDPAVALQFDRETDQYISGFATGLVYAKQLPFRPDMKILLNYGKIGAPLGCTEDVDRFLRMSGRLSIEYYPPTVPMPIYTVEQLERKLTDLEKMDVIIVPRGFGMVLHPMDQAHMNDYESRWFSSLMLFPINFRQVNRRFMPEIPIMEVIAAHYKLVAKFRDCYIMARK